MWILLYWKNYLGFALELVIIVDSLKTLSRIIFNTESKEQMQKFIVPNDSRYIYQNALDKLYLQHNMAYGYYED